MVINEEKLSFKWPEYTFSRSQDLEPFYHDAGQFYCLNVKSFEEQKSLFMKNTCSYVRDEMEVQDIDNMSDWKLAELKYRILQEK